LIIVVGLMAAAVAWLAPGADTAGRPAPLVSRTDEDTDKDTETRQRGEPSMSTSAEASGRVAHADEASFERLVLQSPVPVLVDFYADWCGPCRMIAPVLEQLAREAPGVRIVKVNVDDNHALAARYGIRSIPSLLVFRDGQVVTQHVGMATKAELRSLLGI